MPRVTARRSVLAPEIIEQLRALFGTVKNTHARLGLGAAVPLSELQRGMSGWGITVKAERLVVSRWAEWQATFLDQRVLDPTIPEAERAGRQRGDYYDPAARNEDGMFTFPAARFTLVDDPTKHLAEVT